jgi:RAB protein geranylgeranyltransferase component A
MQHAACKLHLVLPPCTPPLHASALSRAGRSVLLLDACDWYGAGWASLPGATFGEMLLTAAAGPTSPDPQQQSAAAPAPPPAAAAPADPLPAGARFVPLTIPEPWAALSGAALHVAPGAEGFPRGCIVDLAPKAIYQAEGLVEALVGSKTSRYLDLKLVDGR